MAVPSSLPNRTRSIFNDETQNIRSIQEQYTRGSLRLINGTETAIKKISEQIEMMKQQIKEKEETLFSNPEGSSSPSFHNYEQLRARHKNLCAFIERVFEQKALLKILETQFESLSAQLTQLNYTESLFSSATQTEENLLESHSVEDQEPTVRQHLQKLAEQGYKLLMPIESQLQENSKQTEILPLQIGSLRSRL